MNDSVSELRKKTRQLDNYLGEIDWRDEEKISRVSLRNNNMETRANLKNKLEAEEEEVIIGYV
jgi:hypothetical protein